MKKDKILFSSILLRNYKKAVSFYFLVMYFSSFTEKSIIEKKMLLINIFTFYYVSIRLY
jgi:hypothetical protein